VQKKKKHKRARPSALSAPSSRLSVCGLGGQPHISLAFIFFIQWVDMYFLFLKKIKVDDTSFVEVDHLLA
jgi:hypothetical protein